MTVDSASSERAVGISLCEVFRENGEGERVVWLSLEEELRFIGLSGRLLEERDVVRCRVIAPGIFNNSKTERLYSAPGVCKLSHNSLDLRRDQEMSAKTWVELAGKGESWRGATKPLFPRFVRIVWLGPFCVTRIEIYDFESFIHYLDK
jgi:hypothetical protein